MNGKRFTRVAGTGRNRGRKRLTHWRRAIERARSTDDLLDLQRALGPIDEADPAAEELCYELCAAACYLSGGPAPARGRFTLVRPVPAKADVTFTVRGRIGERIAAVIWADGVLYGSLYALARVSTSTVAADDPGCALERIVAAFDEVSEAPAPTAFAAMDRRVA